MSRPPRGKPPPGEGPLDDYTAARLEIARECGAEPVLAGVAARLAGLAGAPALDLELTATEVVPTPEIPEPLARPELLGWLHEAMLDPTGRRRSGSFYTPADVAAGVIDLVETAGGGAPATVCDPALGGGVFLLAAARALHRDGRTRREVVTDHLWGADVDPLAVRVARDSLRLWVAEDDGRALGRRIEPRVVAGDTLLGGLTAWSEHPDDGFDAVVGNPPFLGQLRKDTARSRSEAARLRTALPGLGAYTDTAALFLVRGIRMVRPGGVVALVVPESVLAARDAAAVRVQLGGAADLRHVWFSREQVFAARVRVCVPVLQRKSDGDGDPSAAITRSTGRSFRPAPAVPARSTPLGGKSWAGLVAGLTGVPEVVLARERTLEAHAETTAGFRDQYYGLRPFVVDDPDGRFTDASHPRLVTSGAIDVAACSWGVRPTSFARQRWAAPRIDLDALRRHDPSLHAWAFDRLRPKLVVAQQTRLIEAAVDEVGCWYPSTPTIAVTPAPGDLWSVAAVVLAPPVAAWMHGEMAGSGLAAGHLRLTAARLREVPLPTDLGAFKEGADLICDASRAASADDRRTLLAAFGTVMTRAYRAPDAITDWWLTLLDAAQRA